MAIILKKILFVCIENAGRSQMAEAFAKKYGEGKINASSAGNKPAETVNPVVVEAMKERGIDISANKPKLITAKMASGCGFGGYHGLQCSGYLSRPVFCTSGGLGA